MSRPSFLPPPLPGSLLALLVAAPGGLAQQAQPTPAVQTLPSAPLTQTSREVTAPLTLTPLGSGYVSVQNTSAFRLRASVLVTGAPDDQTRASRAGGTPCATLDDVGQRDEVRTWRGPLNTLNLNPGEQVCLWVAGESKKPVTGAQFRISTPDLGGWVVDSAPRRVTHVVPAAPQVTAEFSPWRAPEPTGGPCPSVIEVISAQGRSLKICVEPTGRFLGLAAGAGRVTPGVYRNGSAFGQVGADGQVSAAPYTLEVRAPVWWAAALIALGLILPALLKFMADRHREKLALRLALREEALDLRRLPGLVAGPFVLDVPAGLLDARQWIAPWQPFSDVRAAYRALLRWRDVPDPDGVLARLTQARISLEAQFGPLSGYRPSPPARHEARVLAFLREVATGDLLGLPLAEARAKYQVGVTRAPELVDILEAARRLARTVERLDLPYLQRATQVPAGAAEVVTALRELVVRLSAAPATQGDVLDALRAADRSLSATKGVLGQLNGALGSLPLQGLLAQLNTERESVQSALNRLVDLASRSGSGTLPPPFQTDLRQLAERAESAAKRLTDLQAGNAAAFRELEATLFGARPASTSVADIDEYTARVSALACAALAEASGGTPAAVPPPRSNGGDTRGGRRAGTPVGGLLRASNAGLRWVTLPLLVLALLLAVVTGLNALYYGHPDAWGSRPLDPFLAVAWGSGTFAVQALLEGAYRMLAGSAWQPGLLRALPGARP